MKKPTTFNLQSRIRSALRKLWLWSPNRRDAMNAAKVSRGIYHCSKCKRDVPRKETTVDHTTPVTPVTGFDTWDNFIIRLFCPPSKLKVMCRACHKEKTLAENRERRGYRFKRGRELL